MISHYPHKDGVKDTFNEQMELISRGNTSDRLQLIKYQGEFLKFGSSFYNNLELLKQDLKVDKVVSISNMTANEAKIFCKANKVQDSLEIILHPDPASVSSEIYS